MVLDMSGRNTVESCDSTSSPYSEYSVSFRPMSHVPLEFPSTSRDVISSVLSLFVRTYSNSVTDFRLRRCLRRLHARYSRDLRISIVHYPWVSKISNDMDEFLIIF